MKRLNTFNVSPEYKSFTNEVAGNNKSKYLISNHYFLQKKKPAIN